MFRVPPGLLSGGSPLRSAASCESNDGERIQSSRLNLSACFSLVSSHVLSRCCRIAAGFSTADQRSPFRCLSLNSALTPSLLFCSSSTSSSLSSAVDQSGSLGSGQPLVNAIRTDSALIGGTERAFFNQISFHVSSPHQSSRINSIWIDSDIKSKGCFKRKRCFFLDSRDWAELFEPSVK